MKRHTEGILRVAIVSLLLAVSFDAIYSQSSRITSVTSRERGNKTSGFGRNFWFVIPQNADPNDHSQKYFTVYINSLRNTTVNLQVGGGPIIRKPVTAGRVTIFTSPSPKFPNADISVSTEVTTSGVVETKSVHVWSDSADISVYLLSRVPYTSDGMYVVPTTGWGKDYVVASFSSLLVSQNLADYPSEFDVVADQNNTVVTITPSYDLRRDGFPNVVQHPKGVPFTQILNKGECVQYQVTGSSTGEEDVTGTIVSANKPVGVIGASVCPFIPSSDQYCDYILDMMQPIRSWSDSYLTVPFAGRKYGGDAFLVVASQSQTIYRNGTPVATLPKFGYLFIYDDSPTPPASWTSTQPFMLVQYVCSSTHDAPNAGNRNLGDPAMVVINATAQFRKDLFFQTPTIDEASGQKDFTNYLNIILPTSHESATTFDGHRLSDSIPGTKLKERFPIANTGWEGMRLTFSIGTGEGSHHLISDTAIGAYVYGYGTDDSYAWSANLGVVTINSPDTVAPMATVTGSCLCSHISVRDVGSVQSKISAIYTDSIFNVAYTIDTNFVAGAETDSSYFDLCVLDPSKEGFVSVSIYDVAGNKTMITIAYKPHLVAFSPAVLDFGFVGPGASAALYDTICNIGETPYHIAAADLTLAGGGLSDAMGLSIDSLGADGDLALGECRVIKVRYAPSTSLSLKDTIFIADSCLKFACPVKSIGSVPDFSLSDFDFKCVDIGTTKTLTATIATNLSTIPLTIDSIWVDDTLHFGYDPTAPSQNNLPFTLPAHGQHSVQCSFKPDTVGPFSTTIHFRSTEVGARTATLLGCGQLPAAVGGSGYASSLSSGSPEYISVSAQLDRGSDLVLLPPIPNPVTKDKKTIRFIYGCKFDSPVDLAIFDILGNRIANVVGDGYQAAGIYEADFAPGWALPAGDYLYRLSASGKVISGKLVITR